jgi:hypothetical protein
LIISKNNFPLSGKGSLSYPEDQLEISRAVKPKLISSEFLGKHHASLRLVTSMLAAPSLEGACGGDAVRISTDSGDCVLYDVNEISNKGNWIFFRHHYMRNGYGGSWISLYAYWCPREWKDERKEHSKGSHTL